MANPTVSSLLQKAGDTELLKKLTGVFTTTELNSFLLEVFRGKAKDVSPATLLQAYQQNRFVQPSVIDAIQFLESELSILKLSKNSGFESLELSPLAPLGNCSALALVDQNKIVSALRGTEIVADATNLLTLEAAVRRKASGFDASLINLCAVHRHVRAQALPPVKGFTAHFKVFCAVTAGRDSGNFQFEMQSLLSHLMLYRDYLKTVVEPRSIRIILKILEGDESEMFGDKIFTFLQPKLIGVDLSRMFASNNDHRYYQRLRFSINVIHNGQELNLGDGGFVDWATKLTSNNKERILTSGLGLELLLKLKNGLI
jgi:hypothetical protein